MAENLMDLLDCHICFQTFDDNDRKPKVLPCQHTFCLSCLKQMAVSIPTTDNDEIEVTIIKCPECNRRYKVPDGEVANFVNDLTMIKLLDAVTQTSKQSNDVSDDKESVSDHLLCVQTKLSDIAEIRAKDISSWGKEVTDTKAKIEDTFVEIQSILDEKKTALLRQVDEFCHTRDALHKSMNPAFESQIQEITQFCLYAEEMISKSSKQVSEYSITDNLIRCQEIIEQLEQHFANNTNKKWKVKFQTLEKGSIKASIEAFVRLDLESPTSMIADVDPQCINSRGGTGHPTNPQMTMTASPFIPSSAGAGVIGYPTNPQMTMTASPFIPSSAGAGGISYPTNPQMTMTASPFIPSSAGAGQIGYQTNPQMTMSASPFIPSSAGVGYPTNPQTTMTASPFNPSLHATQLSAQYIMQQQMIRQSNLHTPRQHELPGQSQQTPVLQQLNTPPFYQGSPPVSAHSGAISQQSPLQRVMQQRQRQQQQLRPPQQNKKQRSRLPKERKKICITDPTSNTDITDSILRGEGTRISTETTRTHSGRILSTVANDKARAIQASFAAQVALAAADNRPRPQRLSANNLGNN